DGVGRGGWRAGEPRQPAGSPPRIRWAARMDANGLLTTLAQLGVALAGFSGVVVALGARARGQWSSRERGLLLVLLERRGAVVLWRLLPLLFLAAELAEPMVWFLSSTSWVIVQGAYLVRGVGLFAKNPSVRRERILSILFVGTVAALAVQITNLVWLRVAWPHLAAITWHLAVSFVVFGQLLQI